jgi:uncharacterized protein YjiS (DUF1127 family)
MRNTPKSAAEAILAMSPAGGNVSWPWLRTQLSAARRMIAEWRRRHRSRQELRALSPHEVRDFCLDPIEAEREIKKPFWRS